ncbi:MAG: YncE family protein [Fibrobacteres bacterium]|nr:YncE family protein [Fibrobacterota bacterium]
MSTLSGAAPGPAYTIANKFHLPGDGRWDFLAADPASGRVFVSHGDQTQVMDERTGALLGAVPDTKGVHGIALAPELGKGYISGGKDTAITVFDLKSLATLRKVKATGINPDAILFDPASKRVFAFNGKTKNATVLDAVTDSVVATLALNGKPEVAVADGKGRIFLNLEDAGKLAVLDAKSAKVLETWSLAPGEEPSGLAMDTAAGRLFSVCSNKMMIVLDAATGRRVATVPIGTGVDGVAYDPDSKRIFASNGEGTLTIVQAADKDHYSVLQTLPTQKGARTIALDPKTHHLFLSTAGFGPAPAATPDNPKARPPLLPDSFVIFDIAPAT